MTLPSSGTINHKMIQDEFGGSNPISMTEYYGADTGIPGSGTIKLSDFYGKSSGPTPPPPLGSDLEGGVFAGVWDDNGAGIGTHWLILAKVSSPGCWGTSSFWNGNPGGGISLQFSTTNSSTSQQVSFRAGKDGYWCTYTAMTGSNYKAAARVRSLNIGGYTDWYIPSFYEMRACYWYLKPSTGTNWSYFQPPYGDKGDNPYTVPKFPAYTSSNPTQTTAAIFKESGGAEAFPTSATQNLMCTTQYDDGDANSNNYIAINFGNGLNTSQPATSYSACRAMRKIRIP